MTCFMVLSRSRFMAWFILRAAERSQWAKSSFFIILGMTAKVSPCSSPSSVSCSRSRSYC